VWSFKAKTVENLSRTSFACLGLVPLRSAELQMNDTKQCGKDSGVCDSFLHAPIDQDDDREGLYEARHKGGSLHLPQLRREDTV
jgi:hypothetical protein